MASAAAVNDGYSDNCSSTCRTHRSLTFGSIFFGMVGILPTHKDAASNLGRFTPDETALGDRLTAIGALNAEDLSLVTSFVDALVTKTRLKVLASGS